MIVAAVGDTKAKVKVDLTKALNFLVATEEGERRSEAEIARLEV